jgi:hypothetical protein
VVLQVIIMTAIQNGKDFKENKMELYSSQSLNIFIHGSKLPVSIAARSKASTVFGRSNIGIAGSNPARGMDVCLCFSVLCCPVCR